MYVNEIFDANIVKKTYLNYISLIECCIYCNPIRKNQYFSFHFPFIPTKTGNTKMRAMMEKSSPPHDPTAKENQKGLSCPLIRNGASPNILEMTVWKRLFYVNDGLF
jgi:hypothetical protein